MKTTIKLAGGRALVIEPGAEAVKVSLTVGGIVLGCNELTADQTGAMLFGVEQALEARAVRTGAQASAAVRTGA